MSRRKEFPIQLFDPEVVRQVDAEVERLFRDMPRKCGTNCVNPDTGGWYVAGLDPVKPQKEKARRALLARNILASMARPTRSPSRFPATR